MATKRGGDLRDYAHNVYGPLFAISDEGSAGQSIVNAAYASPKARALEPVDPLELGVILDGERMTSAGEVPIGPDEYRMLSAISEGRVLCTTNVGVRTNAKLAQPLPEFTVSASGVVSQSWFDTVVGAFAPFIQTPDGRPRPLTVRLVVGPEVSADRIREIVSKLERYRQDGKIGEPQVHRLSLLLLFDGEIATPDQIARIRDALGAASVSGVPELAIDGDLRSAARSRLGVQSLLNVLDPEAARQLLKEARERGVRLTYRYQLDIDTVARTIWTGLYAARANGLAAGKYGLVPLTLPEQRSVIEQITRWTRGWLAIPAFYVDIPLVDEEDVYDVTRCSEGAHVWLTAAREAGASIVLFDAPDRINPRKLLRRDDPTDQTGALTIKEVEQLLAHSRQLGIEILWSGGVTSRQAYELARRRVFGIFSTSSTARRVPVSQPFARDWRLPAENEPTEGGVYRIHSVIQGGFLSSKLAENDAELAALIESRTNELLGAEGNSERTDSALKDLDLELTRGWTAIRNAKLQGRSGSRTSVDQPVPVASSAVRVFRGRRLPTLPQDEFLSKLGTVFMPMTVQMQRLYGLTAYLPAVLPLTHDASLPDEIALVFYETQGAYRYAKECVGGRAYGELHDLVFDMKASASAFPKKLDGAPEFDEAYHLFDSAIDWQEGSVWLHVGMRDASLNADAFRAAVGSRARRLQKSPGHVDGAILTMTAEWLIIWVHRAEGVTAPFSLFSDITKPVLACAPKRLKPPPELTTPFEGIALATTGEFLSMQFPRK